MQNWVNKKYRTGKSNSSDEFRNLSIHSILDSRPFYNWLYGRKPISDTFTFGASCKQAVPGTDLNQYNGAHP